jgi:hypothetical protein
MSLTNNKKDLMDILTSSRDERNMKTVKNYKERKRSVEESAHK